MGDVDYGREGRARRRALRRRKRLLLGMGGVVLVAALAAAAVVAAPYVREAWEAQREPEPVVQSDPVVPEPEPETETEEEAEEPPASTPRALWKKGSMPNLYQTDPEWADVEYSGGTLADQGCGPTALSMVYIYLTGDTELDPPAMARFSTEAGYSTELEGSYRALMSDGAELLGLKSRIVDVSPEGITAELEAGRPVICVVGPGVFTEIGHFIVIERLTTGGKVVVHDPNSLPHSVRSWDLETICEDGEAAWSYSVDEKDLKKGDESR